MLPKSKGCLTTYSHDYSVFMTFQFAKKPTFPNSNSTRNQVDEESLCGCATSKSLFLYFIHFIIQLQSGSTGWVGCGGRGGGGRICVAWKMGCAPGLVLAWVCDVYKKAYLRKTSFTSSSLNGHIPPDTKTNALSSPGIISCLELPSAYVTFFPWRSCITAFVRWLWQQISLKMSGISGRK